MASESDFLRTLYTTLHPVCNILSILLGSNSLNLFGLVCLPNSSKCASAVIPVVRTFNLCGVGARCRCERSVDGRCSTVLLSVLGPLLSGIRSVLGTPIRALVDVLPGLSLFFTGSKLLRIVRGLAAPVETLVSTLGPVTGVGSVLITTNLGVRGLLSNCNLINDGCGFSVCSLATSLGPLVNTSGVINLLGGILNVVGVSNAPLNVRLVPVS